MSMLKKAMIYLGLGPDEHYESYDDPTRSPASGGAGLARYPAGRSGAADQIAGQPAAGSSGAAFGQMSRTVRPVAATPAERSAVSPVPDPSGSPRTVRPQDRKTMKPHAVSPEAFSDAQDIGDRFKSGQPVIVNLQAVDRDLRRRLVDFSAGLCYAIGGKMDRVADQVYLLTPPEVEVAQEPARSPRG